MRAKSTAEGILTHPCRRKHASGARAADTHAAGVLSSSTRWSRTSAVSHAAEAENQRGEAVEPCWRTTILPSLSTWTRPEPDVPAE